MNTTAIKQAERFFYKFAIISSVIMVIAAIVISNHWEDIQRIKWKYRAKQEPDRYSKCLICGILKPHKIMYDYGVGVWVGDEPCRARYRHEDIMVRVDEELQRRAK